MSKRKEATEPPSDYVEFSEWFFTEYAGSIYRHISRRLIPNRYSHGDVKNYMCERMLDILTKRLAKGNPIKEPKIYFRKLIPYWCVEFQRMNGFVYCLPKRPRCPKAEEEIAKHGFVYLRVMEDSDSSGGRLGGATNEHVQKLAYIDTKITNPPYYGDKYQISGINPDSDSSIWGTLLEELKEEERGVITYIFKYNLTVPEAARELGIAVSTAYQRKDRALVILSGFIDRHGTTQEHASWRVLTSLDTGA